MVKQNYKLILSNGLLWSYIQTKEVHLFSLGNWLLSYKIPKQLEISNNVEVVDSGNSAVFKYPNGQTRKVILYKNHLEELTPFAEKIKVNPVFSNSLLFRGDVDLPLNKTPITGKEKDFFSREGYPSFSFLKEKKKFSVTVYFNEEQSQKIDVVSFDDWLKEMPKITMNNKHLLEIFKGSLRSLYKLRMVTPDGEIRAAGLPDFPSLFGRDFAIGALAEIYLHPEKVKEEICVHLKHIGKKRNIVTNEIPGRAVHEFNYDYETISGKYQHFPSWYANDSNALLLLTLFRLARIQNDFTIIEKYPEEIKNLWNHMLSLDLDGDGFLEYKKESGQLLTHQTWRDGGDEIRHADDSKVMHPIAPLHDQLCMYGAMLEIFQYQWYSKKSPINIKTKELSDKFNILKNKINEKYWMDDFGAFAIALDGNNEQVKVVNSDVCLGYYFKIFEQFQAHEQYKAIIDSKRLLDKTGIRTISKEHPSYNPRKYQRGGVWPWQLALSIVGLQKYHFDTAPLIDCLKNISLKGSIAEVYIPDQEILTPMTSCIEQRWSAIVPWLILLEGLFDLNAEYGEFPYPKGLGNINIFGEITIQDLPLWNERTRLYFSKNETMDLLRENEKRFPK